MSGYRRLPDGTIELDPIDIEGDPGRDEYDIDPLNPDAIEVDPIHIEGTAAPIHKTPPALGSVVPENETAFDRLATVARIASGRGTDADARRVGRFGDMMEAEKRSASPASARALGVAEGVPILGAFVDELEGLADPNDFGDYETARDFARTRNRMVRDLRPTESMEGTALGMGLSMPALMMGPAAPSSAMGRIVMGAAEGGAFGAAEGFGRSEADDAMGQLQDTGIGAGVGALAGAGTSGAIEGVRAAGRGIGNRLAASADRLRDNVMWQQLRAGGAESVAALNKVESEMRIPPQRIASTLEDLGVDSPEQLQAIGSAAGSVIRQVEDAVSGAQVDLRPTFQALQSQYAAMPQGIGRSARAAIRDAMDALREASAGGQGASFDQVRRVARLLEKEKSRAMNNSDRLVGDALRDAYDSIMGAVQDTVARQLPEQADDYAQARLRSAIAQAFKKATEGDAKRANARMIGGLMDTLLLTGGGASGFLHDAMGESEGYGGGLSGLALGAGLVGARHGLSSPAFRRGLNRGLIELGETLTGPASDAVSRASSAVGRAVATSRGGGAVDPPTKIVAPEPAEEEAEATSPAVMELFSDEAGGEAGQPSQNVMDLFEESEQ